MNKKSTTLLLFILMTLALMIPKSLALVSFSEATPDSQLTTFNPMLSIKIIDDTNNMLIVQFWLNDTGKFNLIGEYNGMSGIYKQNTSTVLRANRFYDWRVRVYDGVSWKESPKYTFWTGPTPFVLKWSYNLSFKREPDTNLTNEQPPLSADLDLDGYYDIIVTGGDNIYAISGKTGRIMWNYTNVLFYSHQPVDIGDLNKDGYPEILIPSGYRTMVLHGNNGSIFWDVPVSSQDKHPIIVDTNGDGYPYVYIADSDITKGENGTARIRKLNGTTGEVLAEVFSWRPCYGGLSAADANNDGKFEIYMCDRRTGYEPFPGGLGKGMQAYNADNLSLLWYNGSLTCSSHLIALYDLTGDGILDSIALNQNSTNGAHGGICVVDGKTGKTIKEKCILDLGMSNDEPFSMAPFDDGRVLLVSAKYSKAQVWDLVTMTKVADLDYFIEPPKLVDVHWDKTLEIVGFYNNYMYIYRINSTNITRTAINRNLIETSPARMGNNFIVQDIDNDGQLELINLNYDGVLIVYETPAYAPEKRLRTEHMYYSERRLGSSIYVPPAGAPQPFILNEYPQNKSIDININPKLSFKAVDYRHEKLDIELSIEKDNSFEVVKTWKNVSNGVYEFTPENMNIYNKNYRWKVKVVDSYTDNITVEKIFTFRTKQGITTNGWQYKKQIIVSKNMATGNISNYPLLIVLDDVDLRDKAQPNGNDIYFTAEDGITKLSHEIESYENGKLVAWVKTNISNTKDTVLYIYYGNSAALNQEDKFNVWDNNYMAVHHFEETGSIATDSTSNNRNGVVVGNINLVNGKVGKAYNFDGLTGYVNLSRVFTNQNQFTIEGWFYSGNKQGYGIAQRDLNSNGVLLQFNNPSTGSGYYLYVDGQNRKINSNANEWHYIVATYDGTNARFYYDNLNPVVFPTTLNWPNVPLIIGNRHTLDRYWLGVIDEVRISNIARDQNYIRTAYNNMNNPTNYISVGQEIMTAGAVVISNIIPEDNSLVSLNTNNITFELFDNEENKMNYTIISNPRIGSIKVINATNGKQIMYFNTSLTPSTNYTLSINVTNGKKETFKIVRFRTETLLNIEINGTGTVLRSKMPMYDIGDEINLSAIPSGKNKFAGWSRDVNSLNQNISIKLNNNMNIRANFIFCQDDDNDGFSIINNPICGLLDCNDNNNQIYPGAPELLDGLDNNCNGQIDETFGPNEWKYRKNITVKKSITTGNISNYPLLIVLDDVDLRDKAQPNGNDIYFTAEDGITKLSHEIESYENGKLVAWVKTNISNTKDTVLYIYYGNSAALNQEDKFNVWDNNYMAVHHFEETGSIATDSTANNRNGVVVGNINLVNGKVGKAYNFDGLTGYVNLSRVFTNQNQFTIEGWFYSGNKQGYGIAQRDLNSNGVLLQFNNPSTGSGYYLYVDGQNRKINSNANEWHYIVATYDGTNARFYYDAKTPSVFTAPLNWPNVPLIIGNRHTLDRYWLGIIDEVRISNIARDQNYIRTAYNNMNNPTNYIVLGSEENI